MNEISTSAATVKSQLRRLVIIAILSVVLILGLVAIILNSNSIKNGYISQASIANAHLKETLEQGNEIWDYDEENGILTCNGDEVTVDLFDLINSWDNTVYHTIFWDDTRVLTNIKNEDGAYAVGTQADSSIYSKVKNGETYTQNGVKIFGKRYTVCYMPFYSGGEFKGMVFTGIDQSAVSRKIVSMAIAIIGAAIVVLVVFTIITRKALNRIALAITEKLVAGYDNLNNFADNVKEISERTNKEVSEISRAMDSVANGATSQAAATEQAMASTEEFTASIDVVNLEITESYNFIDTIKSCVNESQDSLAGLNDCIDNNNRIVDDISIDIENGVENTRKAKTIVKTIDNLAFQINLLALNASVEASHAGKYGAGFAVVADEIKNLAASSAESANNTADIIADIVGTMTKTQESNKKLVDSNQKQLVKAQEVYSKMLSLKENIEELVEKLNKIKDNSDSLGTVKNELVEVIQTLSATSEDNAAVSEQVSASTETVETDIDNLTSSLDDISGICDNMKSIIDFVG